MEDFKFPANIRQIGSIDESLKIYVEDYVVSYLKQHLNSHGYDEQLVILMGKEKIIDEQNVIFISGAIEGRYTEEENGIIQFSDKTWEYVLAQKEDYFGDLDVIGFVQSQPSYGIHLNSNYANYHINNFKKSYHVLFVWDPIENINAFYKYNEDKTDLVETSGYFIYYDKNRNMHEYMLQNKTPTGEITSNKSKEEPYVFTEDKTVTYLNKIKKDEKTDKDETKKPNLTNNWFTKNFDDEDFEMEDMSDISIGKEKEISHKPIKEQKRAINLLVGLSAVLFILTFVMGMGLMQNDDRISLLENDLKILSTSYRNLLTTVKDTAVFASQDESRMEEAIVNKTEDNETNKSGSLIEEDGNLLDPIKDEEVEVFSSDTQIIVDDQINSDVPEYYTVQKGDNLIQISLKFYGTRDMTDKIMEVNGLDNADKINYGKKIKLPRP